MPKENVTQLKKEPAFDTSLNVADKTKISANTESADVGYIQNLKQVLLAGVEYAKQASDYHLKFQKDLVGIYDATKDLALKTKLHELENALQEVFIRNSDNEIACNEGWNAVIAGAKKDKVFKKLATTSEIQNYADNITTKNRLTLTAKTLARKNSEIQDLSINELQTKQNALQIALVKLSAPDDEVRKEGFLGYCTSLSEIEQILSRKNYTGGDVFGTESKLNADIYNRNLLAQTYAQAKFESTENLLDKANFIREVADGTHKFNLKEYYKIPDELFAEAKLSKEVEFGEFDFSAIDYKTRTGIAQQLRSSMEKQINSLKTVNLTGYADKIKNGEFPKMPSDKTYQKAVSAKYDEVFDTMIAPIYESQDPRKYGQILKLDLDFIHTYQDVPQRLTESIKTAMISQNPELFKSACAAVGEILSDRNTKRIVFEDKSFFEDGSLALWGASLMRNGMPPAMAYEAVRNEYNTPENIRKQREKTFDDKVKNGEFGLKEFLSTGDFVTDNGIKGLWVRLTEPPSYQEDGNDLMMYRQLIDITKGFFAKTGNFKSAKEAAQNLLKQKWGVTRINYSKEIAPYPVEHFYANNAVSVEALQKRVENRAAQLGELYGVKDLALKVCLKADTQTYQEIANGEKPSYRMYFKNELGDYDDNINGDIIRCGADVFEDKKDKEANGTQNVEAIEQQLNDIKDSVENGQKMSAMAHYVETYLQQQGGVKK